MNRRESYLRGAKARQEEAASIPDYIVRHPRQVPASAPPVPVDTSRDEEYMEHEKRRLASAHTERLARFNQRPTLAPSFASGDNVATRQAPKKRPKQPTTTEEERRARELDAPAKPERSIHKVRKTQPTKRLDPDYDYSAQPANEGDDTRYTGVRFNPELGPPPPGSRPMWKDVHGIKKKEIDELDRSVRAQRYRPLGPRVDYIEGVINQVRHENNFSTRQLAEYMYKECGTKVPRA